MPVTVRAAGSARSAGNLVGLLAALARGGLLFIAIIWLEGIYLPRHGDQPGLRPGPVGGLRLRGWRLPDRRSGLAAGRREVRLRRIGRYYRPARRGHRGRLGLARIPPLTVARFTRIVRWPLILPVAKLAAEFSRAEGITIKRVIRGTSAGFADAR